MSRVTRQNVKSAAAQLNELALNDGSLSDFFNQIYSELQMISPLCPDGALEILQDVLVKLFKHTDEELLRMKTIQSENTQLEKALRSSKRKLDEAVQGANASEDGWFLEKLELNNKIKTLSHKVFELNSRPDTEEKFVQVDSTSQFSPVPTAPTTTKDYGVQVNRPFIRGCVEKVMTLNSDVESGDAISRRSNRSRASRKMSSELAPVKPRSFIHKKTRALDEWIIIEDWGHNQLETDLSVSSQIINSVVEGTPQISTPLKKVSLVGDSFMFGLNGELSSILPRNFAVSSICMDDAPLSVLVRSLAESNELPDYIVLSAGSVDVAYNELRSFKHELVKLCTSIAGGAKLLIMCAPFNYRLPCWSIVNAEISRLNKFIRNLSQKFDFVRVIDLSLIDERMIRNSPSPYYRPIARSMLCKRIKVNIMSSLVLCSPLTIARDGCINSPLSA
uniref:Uncharacterized protein n=1 Tax=Lygus hesperus TaxID=30085 RepID=A0A0A9XP92_LYGHE